MAQWWYAARPMPWLSLPDYARRTGTPESTVRALIRAGKLEAHQEQRAPGDPRVVWKVLVDDPQDQPPEHPQPASDVRVPSESPQAPAAATEPPAAPTRTLDMLEDRLDFADALIREERAERQRLVAENAELRERVGRAEQRADSLQAERDRLIADLDRLRARRSVWKPWTW